MSSWSDAKILIESFEVEESAAGAAFNGGGGGDEEEYVMGVQNGTLGAAEMAEGTFGNWARAATMAAGMALPQQPREPPPDRPAQAVQAHAPYKTIDKHIEDLCVKHGISPLLVRAMIHVESRGKMDAESEMGAQGLMQLMPNTAKSLGVKDAKDPHQNIEGGVKHIAHLLRQTNGNVDRALIYYNFGPTNYIRANGKLPRETRDYIARVKEEMRRLSGHKKTAKMMQAH